jgi:hypothetical protein
MRFPPLVVLSAVACQSVAATGQPSTTLAPLPITRLRPQPVAFETNSGLVDSLRLVVRDTSSWRELWQRINRPFIPQPALPAIDFDRDMVIVAALGTKPSGGYDVIIEGAEEDSAGIEVSVKRSTPGAGCALTAALTQPVDLATVPARRVPVRFRERRVEVPCGGS